MIVSFDLHLLAFIFNRTIHGFEYAYDFSALDSAAYWALPQPHALQEMTALILERLRGFDPRTDDVAVAKEHIRRGQYRTLARKTYSTARVIAGRPLPPDE